jgi:hypothetical protein
VAEAQGFVRNRPVRGGTCIAADSSLGIAGEIMTWTANKSEALTPLADETSADSRLSRELGLLCFAGHLLRLLRGQSSITALLRV